MGKGIQDYVKSHLSKLKKKSNPNNRVTGTNWLLSACNHPKTTSFAAGRHQPSRSEDSPRTATVSDVDRFLLENFNSLCAEASDIDVSDDAEERWSTGTPDHMDDLPVILRSSHRFFADPGLSNSIVEEARLSAVSGSSQTGPSEADIGVPEESVAVMTFSKDPYEDFRRSMMEMVEARQAEGEPRQPLDWDFMEDLLICYLELNDRTVHKYILGAFTDLTVSLRRQSGKEKKQQQLTKS